MKGTYGSTYPDAAPALTNPAVLRSVPFWPGILLITLFVPTEFSFAVGSLRLTPYRVVLLLSFLPCLMRLLSGRAGPIRSIDLIIALHLVWSYLVFAYHHGASGLESGGIRMLEMGGAYLIARTCVLNKNDFRGCFALLGVLLCLLAPLVLIESLTGHHFIKNAAAVLTGNSLTQGMEPRSGFYRAYGPFDHPILLGVFAATALSVLWRASSSLKDRAPLWRHPVIAAVLAALTSVSAGALAALGTQFALLLWERKTGHIRRRWLLFFGLLATLYFVVDSVSNRSGMHVFLHYLTFSGHTAHYRIAIFDWGLINVWQNPLLGIGFHDWLRPGWMYSASIDNLWLLQAMTFGIPGFVTFIAPFGVLLASGWRGLAADIKPLRSGWAISLIGMMVAGCTVHFWNNLFVYAFFFLGAGVWFLNTDRLREPGPNA